MGEFIEALGAEMPLILTLVDLLWSDPSTVDLLSLLAARREPARLLVIGTFRPVEMILGRHPLRDVALRLTASRRSGELALDDLGLEAVAEYLELRFPGSCFPPHVARLFHERTDGNPLFLVTLVDHMLACGAILEPDGRWELADGLQRELAAVPESLRLLIEQQLDQLSAEDLELLGAASLAGIEFSAAAAAAGAGRGTVEIEKQCDRLAGAGHFLRHAETAAWPDGTVARCYGFRHALYRETLAASLSPRTRAAAQLRIGTALEEAYGGSSVLASQLAVHFEEGGDRARAARHHRLAAETAARRYAFAEAEIHLERGLALLAGLPASPERDREELSLQSALGPVRMATRGYAAPEVERAYTRALELSSAPQEPLAFAELWGLWGLHLTRAELDRALEFADRVQTIAAASGERLLRLQGHLALWVTHFFRGEFTAALHHLDEGEPLYVPAEDRGSELVYVQDEKAAAVSYRSLLQWSFGRIDQALEMTGHATEHALTLGHPMSLAFSLVNAGWLRLLRREPRECGQQAEAVIAYATEQGVRFWVAHGLLLRGWAFAQQGDLERGIADTEEGLALMTTMETGLGRTAHYAHLAAAKARAGHFAEARELMECSKALVTATGERYHEPEIHRLDAEMVLAEAGGARSAPAKVRERAAQLLHEAIECARRQGARTLELRAATTLARLRGRGAKGRQARARLAELLASFVEGFDTADLQDAQRLLGRFRVSVARRGTATRGSGTREHRPSRRLLRGDPR
jgi:predicted ATPase